MGADLALASLDRELNAPLWGIRAAAHAALDTVIHGRAAAGDDLLAEESGPAHEERSRAMELIWPILLYVDEKWDEGGRFTDPYNETAYSAYMGFSYAPYEHEGRIAPDAAARLLAYLEELEEERIAGPDAAGRVDDYWRSYYFGGQDDNPSPSIQIGKMLQSFYESLPEGATGGAPAHARYQKPEEWLARWREMHERLTGLLRKAIERGEAIECSL